MNQNILFVFLLIFTAEAIKVAHKGDDVFDTTKERPGGKCDDDTQCRGLRSCSR